MQSAAAQPNLNPTIQTGVGYWNIAEPEKNLDANFDIRMLAHAISNICRFTGHVRRFYSVAQHSVLCSFIEPDQDAYAKLMHDIAEALIGDVASPLKQMLNDYKVIERKNETALFSWFGISASFNLPKSVKRADIIMLLAEKRDLLAELPQDTVEWEWAKDVPELDYHIRPWGPFKAKHAFLARFYEICPDRALSGGNRTWLVTKHRVLTMLSW